MKMANVLFVHPDLGIGGAERLVIDAALALKRKSHHVTFVTAHHDHSHCFPETVDGNLNVICAGDWLPRSTFGYMFALWAYLRMIYLAIYIVFFSNLLYDVLFVDQISACIPFLRLKKNSKIIFYCHYPDQLLTDRKSMLKRFYRSFIDKFEEITTQMADIILVNSKFTSSVFSETFKTISVKPNVLYPSFDFSKFNVNTEILNSYDVEDKLTFLSLNRYERKKNVALALESFKLVVSAVGSNEKIQLVIAGGYDSRVSENIEYYMELVELAENLSINDYVKFLKSPSDEVKLSLLHQSTCLLYTPDKEHFGIVPIESMYMGTPVIAVNSGGPTETVIDGTTGFLQDHNPQSFASAMKLFVEKTISKRDMSKACRDHVINEFSFEKFSEDLHYFVQSLFHDRNL